MSKGTHDSQQGRKQALASRSKSKYKKDSERRSKYAWDLDDYIGQSVFLGPKELLFVTKRSSIASIASTACLESKSSWASENSGAVSKSVSKIGDKASMSKTDARLEDEVEVKEKSMTTITSPATTLNAESSDASKKSEGVGRPGVKVNGKSREIRRPVDPRPAGNGCPGKCSRLENPRDFKINSQILSRESKFNEPFADKCRCPSTSAKSKLRETAATTSERKRSKEKLHEQEVHKVSQFVEKLVVKIKKNCKKFKTEIFPVSKKNSATALSGARDSLEILTNGGLEKSSKTADCGSGIEDCASWLSSSSRKSSPRRGPIESPGTDKSGSNTIAKELSVMIKSQDT